MVVAWSLPEKRERPIAPLRRIARRRLREPTTTMPPHDQETGRRTTRVKRLGLNPGCARPRQRALRWLVRPMMQRVQANHARRATPGRPGLPNGSRRLVRQIHRTQVRRARMGRVRSLRVPSELRLPGQALLVPSQLPARRARNERHERNRVRRMPRVRPARRVRRMPRVRPARRIRRVPRVRPVRSVRRVPRVRPARSVRRVLRALQSQRTKSTNLRIGALIDTARGQSKVGLLRAAFCSGKRLFLNTELKERNTEPVTGVIIFAPHLQPPWVWRYRPAGRAPFAPPARGCMISIPPQSRL